MQDVRGLGGGTHRNSTSGNCDRQTCFVDFHIWMFIDMYIDMYTSSMHVLKSCTIHHVKCSPDATNMTAAEVGSESSVSSNINGCALIAETMNTRGFLIA